MNIERLTIIINAPLDAESVDRIASKLSDLRDGEDVTIDFHKPTPEHPCDSDEVEEVHEGSDTFVTERDMIIAALERNDFNRMAACEDLGISPRTLGRKMREYGLA